MFFAKYLRQALFLRLQPHPLNKCSVLCSPAILNLWIPVPGITRLLLISVLLSVLYPLPGTPLPCCSLGSLLLRRLFSAYVSLSCPVLPPQGEVSLLWNSIAPWSSLTTPCEGLLNHTPCYPLSSVRLGLVPLTYGTPST